MNESLSKEERTWGMLSHLAALVGFIIPFGHLIAPLIIWLIKKEEFPFVETSAKEALNFQISVTIYGVICVILTLVLIGFLLAAALAVFEIVMVVMAAVKANDGEEFRYPLNIRFIK